MKQHFPTLLAVCVIASASLVASLQRAKAQPLPTSDWPTYVGNDARNSMEPGENLVNVYTIGNHAPRWALSTGSPISGQPIVTGGIVYMAGNQFAFSPAGTF